MLEVFGHLYSEDATKFREVVSSLEEAGYTVAYDHPTNATIIKEVVEDEELSD